MNIPASFQTGAITTIRLPIAGGPPAIAVSVHIVNGSDGFAIIDSGVVQALPLLRRILDEIGLDVADTRVLLNTHEHMDHLGNNGAIVNASRCLVGAHGSRAHLFADPVENAESFVRRFPDVEPSFEPLKEYRSFIGPHGAPVSLELVEGVRINLGGVDLEVLELPGHTPAEIGFVDRGSRAFVIGDALAPSWLPTLYLYEDPEQIRASLHRIIEVVTSGIVDVLMSGHSDPMMPERAIQMAEACLLDIDRIESAIRDALTDARGSALGQLRDRVTTALRKEREWRALITIHGHLRDLEERGLVRTDGREWWSDVKAKSTPAEDVTLIAKETF